MPQDLPTSLSDALGVISEQLRLRFASTGVEGNGPGFVALATLRHLVRHGPKTVSELARADSVTTQAISLRVAPLVQRGLVDRTRDPADARRTIVSASAAGQRLIAAAHDRGHQALVEALTHLDAQEQEAVRRALPALSHLGISLSGTHESA